MANLERVDEMGSTYARSTYLAVMNLSLCSRLAWGVSLTAGSSLASYTMLDTLFPTRRRSSIISGVNEVVSRVRERTLLTWVPRDRWMPLHSMQTMIARLIDTHSTLLLDPHSAHQQLPWSLSRSIWRSLSGLSSKLVRREVLGRAPTVVRLNGMAFDVAWLPWPPWLTDELLPTNMEPMSTPLKPRSACAVDGFSLKALSLNGRPSTALWSALLIAVIQLFMSSSEVA